MTSMQFHKFRRWVDHPAPAVHEIEAGVRVRCPSCHETARPVVIVTSYVRLPLIRCALCRAVLQNCPNAAKVREDALAQVVEPEKARRKPRRHPHQHGPDPETLDKLRRVEQLVKGGRMTLKAAAAEVGWTNRNTFFQMRKRWGNLLEAQP